MKDLVEFAANRIQEQERLPDINDSLAQGIRDLSSAISKASGESISGVPIEDFVFMLEGVPAANSLRVVVELLNSQHAELIKAHIEKTNATQTRVVYFEKLTALAELFTPVRVARITETAKYIEAGWGWWRG